MRLPVNFKWAFPVLVSLILNFFCSFSWAIEWQEIKGDHFIINYGASEDQDFAREVLNNAEVYYHKVADQIGYVRYQDFWTWENRVKVFLYPDQESFTKETGQPEWSRGFVPRDKHLLTHKFIVTFRQEDGFLEGVLPHEICHLIMTDFLKDREIPAWFDEGMAQLQEKDKTELANRIIKKILPLGKALAFTDLFNTKIDIRKDPLYVTVFYAQSISFLDFLIKKYGAAEFQEFCSKFHDGKPLEEALFSTYNKYVKSIEELETKWFNYMESGL